MSWKPDSNGAQTPQLQLLSLSSRPFQGMHAKLLQLCPTFYDPMDHSPPGSSVHGIFQARILEWVAMPSSGKPNIKPAALTSLVLAGGIFTTEPPGKPNIVYILQENCKIAHHLIVSLMVQTVKNLPAMRETQV